MKIFLGIPDSILRACIQLSARLLVGVVILLLYLNLHIRIFSNNRKGVCSFFSLAYLLFCSYPL